MLKQLGGNSCNDISQEEQKEREKFIQGHFEEWAACKEMRKKGQQVYTISARSATARQIYGSIYLQRKQNSTTVVDLSSHAQKEKCLFNYCTNTLFYKNLFLTIINCYNKDFVKSAIF
jgi:hypothetical protein